MAAKKTKPKYTGPLLEAGQFVKILRPNICWSGCSGTIISVDAATGLHRVHITAKDPETYKNGFNADVPYEQLEVLDLLA